MITLFWVFIVIIILFVIILPKSSTNSTNASIQNEKISNNETLIKINALDPYSAIEYISDLEQTKIDELREVNDFVITDSLVSRAFVKRWRFETIDKEFWFEEIRLREYNKLHKIKRKVKRRTPEQIYNDTFLGKNSGAEAPEIIGYNYVGVFEIKGVNYSGRYDYMVDNCSNGDKLSLQEDDNNKFDSDAVKIKWKTKIIGYVDSIETDMARKSIKYGYSCKLYDFDEVADYVSAYYELYVKKFEN